MFTQLVLLESERFIFVSVFRSISNIGRKHFWIVPLAWNYKEELDRKL